jgi:hypothetical protein
MFITLTDIGGTRVTVNTAQITHYWTVGNATTIYFAAMAGTHQAKIVVKETSNDIAMKLT